VMIVNLGIDYLRESGMELHIKLRYIEIIAWDNELYCYSNEFHSHLPFDRICSNMIAFLNSIIWHQIHEYYIRLFSHSITAGGPASAAR
jgi:hypothetical protein